MSQPLATALAISDSSLHESGPLAGGLRLPALASDEYESQAMQSLRGRLWRANLWAKFRQARLRLWLIVILSTFFWFGLYALFAAGFKYLAEFTDLKETIFNTYFSALMLMLFISSGLIIYTGLYRSDETRFLLTLPIRGRSIFFHKLFEAVWFGGWGFLLTSTPMLVASGVQAQAPWYYYALMLPFLIAFMYIPASLGAMTSVLLVNWMPRRRFQFLAISICLIVGIMGWIGWTALEIDQRTIFSPSWFKLFGERLQFSQQRVLPSWWLCSGLLEAERNLFFTADGYFSWSQSLMFLAVLTSNALVCHLLAVYWGGRYLRCSYQRLQSEYSSHAPQLLQTRVSSANWNSWLGWPLPRSIQLLIQKEWRIFTRDPVQWLQFVVFTGLLTLYLVNLQRFAYEKEQTVMIGFLNLAVVGLILSTFTTRFIYPMVSLEGKRFWILNLLPIDRGEILISKFIFAAVGSWLPCALLILLSDYMLNLPGWMVLLHQVTIAELCIGLAGMAVGLGALMPDLREESPSKIAAGFGGTLNLVLSALYILVLVSATAIPSQMSVLTEQGSWLFGSPDWLHWLGSVEVLWCGQLLNFCLMLAASWWIMHAGIRSFRQQGQ